MTIIREYLKINTNKEFEIIDITHHVLSFLKKYDVEEGLINIYSKHATSAISINENEAGLLSDFELSIKKLSDSGLEYKHDLIDNNAKAHISSFLIGNEKTVPIKDFKLDLGVWQAIFFVELDGPRSSRELVLTIFS